jgi:hypothetical protein
MQNLFRHPIIKVARMLSLRHALMGADLACGALIRPVGGQHDIFGAIGSSTLRHAELVSAPHYKGNPDAKSAPCFDG